LRSVVPPSVVGFDLWTLTVLVISIEECVSFVYCVFMMSTCSLCTTSLIKDPINVVEYNTLWVDLSTTLEIESVSKSTLFTVGLVLINELSISVLELLVPAVVGIYSLPVDSTLCCCPVLANEGIVNE